MIVIVDSGVSNVGAVHNMLRRMGEPCSISSVPDVVAKADRIVVPGVGSFDAAVVHMREGGLFNVLRERALSGTPLLGICMGMQLLADASEEGTLPGLGLIPGQVKRFYFNGAQNRLKVPHMGWNMVNVCRPNRLLKKTEATRFYFAHSYHFVCEDPADVLATTDYGIPFAAAVNRANIWGVQFHPEKSHRFGLSLFENFLSC